MSSDSSHIRNQNTNKDMAEYIKQKQGKALAIYYNNAELADPLLKQRNYPQKISNFESKNALLLGRNTQVSVTLHNQPSQTNPQYAIVRSLSLYPNVNEIIASAPSPAPAPAPTPSPAPAPAPAPEPAATNKYIYQVNVATTSDVYLVKYNTDGTIQWSTRLGSSGGSDNGYGVATDSNGNVFVGGIFNGTLIIYNQDGTSFKSFISTGNDSFIAKYNSSGVAQWAARITGTSTDNMFSIATDSNGNVVVAGHFLSSTLTIYNQDDTSFGTLSNANTSYYDGYVVKYNNSGTVQWSARIRGTSTDNTFAVTTDSTGNVYATGGFNSSPLTIYNQDGTAFATTLSTPGLYDIYLVKYNSSGNAQWVTRISTTASDFGYGLCTDSSSNIYITGYYGAATATVYNQDATSFGTLTNAGGTDIFLVKYNSSGNAQWAASISGSAADIGYSVCSDSSSNLYIVGSFASTTLTAYNQDGTSFATTLSNLGSTDAFVVKYNSSGSVQWVTRIGGSGADIARFVIADANSNIYVTGEYASSPLTIYNQDGTTYGTLANQAGSDAFIVKYNSSGTAQWASRITGAGNEVGRGLASDSNNNLYAIGDFTSSTLNLYNQDGSSYGILGNNGGISFGSGILGKYNSSGNPQWGALASGDASISMNAVYVDSSENVYISGLYSASVATFYNTDRSAFSSTLSVSGTNDAYVVKYNSSGTVQWVARLGGTADLTTVSPICGDSDGNIYASGNYSSSPFTAYNSDGTAFSTTLSNAGVNDVYLVKYNSTGTVQWIATIGGTGTESSSGFACDTNGNVYISGSFNSSTLTFKNSDGTSFATTFATAGSLDCFLAKYNSSGTVQWVTRAAGTGNDNNMIVTIDSNNNIYASCIFASSPLTIYNADGTSFGTLTTAGVADIAIIKYNTSGTVQWTAQIGGTSGESGRDIATDSDGNVFVLGYFASTPTIYNKDGTSYGTLTSAGSNDILLVKYNSSGTVQWATRIGGTASDTSYALCCDSSGNAYLSMVITAAVTIYNQDATTYATVTNTGNDSVIVKYNSSGTCQWYARVPNATLNDLAFSSSGNLYFCGSSAFSLITLYTKDT